MNPTFLNKLTKLTKSLSIKKISIIIAIFILVLVSFYLLNTNQDDNQDTMLLVRTINELQKDIQGFQSQGQIDEIKGKIDPELVKEFQDDEKFLQQIIQLKKEKMLAQLAIDVENLERRRKEANTPVLPPARPVVQSRPVEPRPVREKLPPPSPPPPPPPPRPKIELAMANEANQSAVVILDNGGPITLKVGNVIESYKLVNVTRSYIQVEDLISNSVKNVYIKQSGANTNANANARSRFTGNQPLNRDRFRDPRRSLNRFN